MGLSGAIPPFSSRTPICSILVLGTAPHVAFPRKSEFTVSSNYPWFGDLCSLLLSHGRSRYLEERADIPQTLCSGCQIWMGHQRSAHLKAVCYLPRASTYSLLRAEFQSVTHGCDLPQGSMRPQDKPALPATRRDHLSLGEYVEKYEKRGTQLLRLCAYFGQKSKSGSLSVLKPTTPIPNNAYSFWHTRGQRAATHMPVLALCFRTSCCGMGTSQHKHCPIVPLPQYSHSPELVSKEQIEEVLWGCFSSPEAICALGTCQAPHCSPQ